MANRRRPTYRGKTPEEILEVYPENYRDCRISHDWSRRAIYEIVSPSVRERTEICRRCAGTRSFLIDLAGVRLPHGSRRHYEPGYLTPKSGLRRTDFAARVYNADFERALSEGRVRGQGQNVTSLHSAS